MPDRPDLEVLTTLIKDRMREAGRLLNRFGGDVGYRTRFVAARDAASVDDIFACLSLCMT